MNMREHFDLDEKLIYLNSGTHSIAPRVVLEAVTKYQWYYEKNPTRGLIESFEKLVEIQKQIAAFFGTRAQDVFFRANVTEALNAAILGFALEPGQEILVGGHEYGAIYNICRYRAQREGRVLRSVEFNATDCDATTEDALATTIVSQIRPNTGMLVLSHVLTGNGLILPIERISCETRRRGVLLVVDGAHSAGALKLDLSQLPNVDFYGTNFHKWLMGPKGTGLGWCAERAQHKLRALEGGWTTFETTGDFEPLSVLGRFAGAHFMRGCHDFAPFAALKATLEFWHKLGPENIRNRIVELQCYFERRAKESLNWQLVSPPASCRGPLLSFKAPERFKENRAQIVRDLCIEHGLQIACPLFDGRPVIRVSPHIYNTEEEIDRAIEFLAAMA